MKNATLLIALAVMLFTASSAMAGKRKCAEDYHQLSSQWGLETRGLQNCMRSHGDRLSHACVRGLIAAGAVSQGKWIAGEQRRAASCVLRTIVDRVETFKGRRDEQDFVGRRAGRRFCRCFADGPCGQRVRRLPRGQRDRRCSQPTDFARSGGTATSSLYRS